MRLVNCKQMTQQRSWQMSDPVLVQDSIFKAIKDVIKNFTSLTDETKMFSGFSNRIPEDKANDYCVISILNSSRVSTPRVERVTTEEDITVNVSDPLRCLVQIDFYGKYAQNRAETIVAMSRTPEAVSVCEEYGVTPLYSDEAKNLTGISGESQYVLRYSVDLNMFYNAEVTFEGSGFDEASITKTEGIH